MEQSYLGGSLSRKGDAMRKLIYLLVVLSTFILGVGAYFLWFHFVPVPVTLCDLARHPDWYHQRVVRVTAQSVSLFESLVIYDAGCGSGDAGAVIVRDEDYLPTPEVHAFLVDPAPRTRKADILVVGRFKMDASMGCFGPRFGITATEIELKSQITEEPLRTREE